MGRIIKRYLIISILIIFMADVAIGFLLFRSRLFSHLAIWKIIESSKQNDFYWNPKDAPDYFYFEPDSGRNSFFRNEIYPLVKNESDDFQIVIKVARYVMDISSHNNWPRFSLKWDSPTGMLRQVKEGASANCFHRSILFSVYLSSLGVKSRLWALENEKFNATAHTITEVYIKNLRKWVFIDVMLGFYVTENDNPLSFLELREKLLNGSAKTVLLHNLSGIIEKQKGTPLFYSRLIKCVFLRADNDFVDKYNTRYGIFYVFHRYIDRLPDNIRRGLDYLLGKRDIFVHYIDRFSRSLKPDIITAKLFFYFFVVSLIFIGVVLVILSLIFLKHYLFTNLSKKDTLHK